MASYEDVATDGVDLSGFPGTEGFEIISDGVALSEVWAELYDALATQGMYLSGFPGTEGFEVVSDGVTMLDAISSLMTELSESLGVGASATYEAYKLAAVVDGLVATEALSVLDAVTVREFLGISPVASTAGSTYNSLADQSLSLVDLARLSWALVVAENLTADGAVADVRHTFRTVLETLTMNGLATSQNLAVAAAAVGVALSEAWEAGKGATSTDGVVVTDAVVQRAIMLINESEAVTLAAALADTMVVTAPALDGVEISGTATLNQILQQVLTEGLMFGVTFGLAGEVYSGWVMNVDNFAVSEYQNYPFNSFAKIGNSYYGANDNGLYLLDGEDDAGTDIDATFTTGKMSFGSGLSRVANSYLAMRNDGRVLLKTVTDDDVEHWHEITSQDWTLNDKRVKLGRGLKSRYWQFTVSNADGANFEIDELVLLPIILKRR